MPFCSRFCMPILRRAKLNQPSPFHPGNMLKELSFPGPHKCRFSHSRGHRYPETAQREAQYALSRVDQTNVEVGVSRNWCCLNPEVSASSQAGRRVIVTDVVYSPSTTSPSNKWNIGPCAQCLKVDFLPWVLISSNNDARIVPVNEK